MTTPHPCPDWRELLSAYHDRQLSAAESRPVEDHLDECAACRATLAQWEADRARFTAAFADSTASAAMKKHILQELRNMESSSKEVSLPLGWLRWILGLSTAAVLACVLLFVAVLLMRPGAQVAFLPANPESQVTDDQAKMPLEATTRYLDHKLLHGAREKVDYGYNGYLVPSAPNPVASPVEARRLKAANAYSAKNTFYNRAGDTFVNGPEAEKAYDAFTFTEPTRNYGIPGGIKLAYDADVCVQVADALAQGRKALQAVRDNGGFVIDFSFGDDEGERPWATLRGKVPADKAEATLAAMEKMGRVRALTIAGEDLTEQFQQQIDEIKKQNEHAEKLGKLEDKARRTYPALSAEQQRHLAKEQAAQARRLLHGLAAKHDLVEFSASFVEERPRERMHFSQVVTGAHAVLTFSLLLLATVAVLLLLIGLITSPWMVARYLRQKR